MYARRVVAVFAGFFFGRSLGIAHGDDGERGQALRNAEGPADEDFAGLIRGDAEPYGTEVEVYCFEQDVFDSCAEVEVDESRKTHVFIARTDDDGQRSTGSTAGIGTAVGQVLDDPFVADDVKFPGLLVPSRRSGHSGAQ